MEKLFVSFEIALKLKELGFKEMPFAGYLLLKKKLVYTDWNTVECNDDILVCEDFNSLESCYLISAPLYQQAFDWFESKGYRCYVANNKFDGKVNYWFAINAPDALTYTDSEGRSSKRDAEDACLRKLVEFMEFDKCHENEKVD